LSCCPFICPSCREAFPPEPAGRFCPACGAALLGACPACGQETLAHRYCRHCGEPLGDAPRLARPSAPTPAVASPIAAGAPALDEQDELMMLAAELEERAAASLSGRSVEANRQLSQAELDQLFG
jgi:hypothetical protein